MNVVASIALQDDARTKIVQDSPDTSAAKAISRAPRSRVPCDLLDPSAIPGGNGLARCGWVLIESYMPVGKRRAGSEDAALRGPAWTFRRTLATALGVSLETLDAMRRRLDAAGRLARKTRAGHQSGLNFALGRDGCYVEVPGWWLKLVKGSTNPPEGSIRPDDWWLLARITEKRTTETGWLDGRTPEMPADAISPGVTTGYLAELIGKASSDTGARRLAALEAAGLVEVVAKPGGRIFIRPIEAEAEAALLGARYARNGRRIEAVDNPTDPPQISGVTPRKSRESPPANLGSPYESSSVESPSAETKKEWAPAVGELQVVEAPARPADAGGLTRSAPVKSTAPKGRPTPRQAAQPAPSREVARLYRCIPESLRSLIPEHGSRRVLQALAAELATGHRSLDELGVRIVGNAQPWEWRPEDIQDVTGLVISQIVRRGYDCPQIRCEDRVNLDTGAPCTACAYSAPQNASQPSEDSEHPLTPDTAPEAVSVDLTAVQEHNGSIFNMRPFVERPWCGECDGPELARRYTEDADGRARTCHCHPGWVPPVA